MILLFLLSKKPGLKDKVGGVQLPCQVVCKTSNPCKNLRGFEAKLSFRPKLSPRNEGY